MEEQGYQEPVRARSHKISPQLHFRHKVMIEGDFIFHCTSPLDTVKAIPSTTHASRLDVRKIGWDHANVSIPASKTWK
ncbi:hypothetical protein EMCRGX_G026531 [Ephydatia muelleri]